MQLTELSTKEQLDTLMQADHYSCILKHNTTCPISKGVLSNLERTQTSILGINSIHVLDLLNHRELSNDIAARFDVVHQSPQLLVIKDGKCVYTEWGYDISMEAAQEALEE